MNILFCSQPQIGHLHNLIPLAKKLQSKDVTIIFATSKSLKNEIEHLGFKHEPMGIDFMGFGDLQVELKKRNIIPKDEPFSLKLFVNPLATLSLNEIEKIALKYKPKMIIRDPVEFSSLIVAEKHDIKTLTINWGYNFPLEKSIKKCFLEIDNLRIKSGLKSDIKLDFLMKQKYINLLPEKWYDKSFIENYNVSYYKSNSYNSISKKNNVSVPNNIIYATLGTVFMNKDIISVYIDAFKQVKEQFLISYPVRNQFPTIKNILFYQYIPNNHVLPKAKLVITHGGFNTIRQALSLGIPLIITPITGDQKVYAKKIENLGLGIAINKKDLTSSKLIESINKIKNNSKFKFNALKFKNEINNLDDINVLVEKLLV
ncbi:4'-demethylrebeccamycin synthase [Kordia antarctica]|uniref:4'-demethylrebeccamycin synthase n=1 Tax=Kordia antarctica TaxID=1218801 RepID=A0A7L4ZGU3_9FLAO|nr:glycosyltransferase [Kordia antarctica]QHI35968.1 4'-demethylrebeccamycin synthase [Kordia antarctica]